MNAAPSIVQNFALIGRRSSEITRRKKKKKTTAKHVLPKTIVFGQTNKPKGEYVTSKIKILCLCLFYKHHCSSHIIIIIINAIYIAQVQKMQQMRQVNCYRLSVASVMKNVFSRLRNTDSDMSNRSAVGRLFHTTGPQIAKLQSP